MNDRTHKGWKEGTENTLLDNICNYNGSSNSVIQRTDLEVFWWLQGCGLLTCQQGWWCGWLPAGSGDGEGRCGEGGNQCGQPHSLSPEPHSVGQQSPRPPICREGALQHLLHPVGGRGILRPPGQSKRVVKASGQGSKLLFTTAVARESAAVKGRVSR